MNGTAMLANLNLDCKGFKQLLDTQSLVDCTLACDGGKVSAHKIVLCACSSYLAKILLDHPAEHPIIILPELGLEDVKILIHYMYTGELLKSPTSNSASLLRTAAILSVNSLSDLLAVDQLAADAAATATTVAPPTQNLQCSLLNNVFPGLVFGGQQQFRGAAAAAPGQLQAELLEQQQQAVAAAAAATSLVFGGPNSLAEQLQLFSSQTASGGQQASGQLSRRGGGGAGSSASANSPNTSLSGITLNNYYATSRANGGGASPAAVSPSLSSQNHHHQISTGKPHSQNEFQFKCPVCQNDFQTICSFEYHMQRVHNVTSFGCEICHKPFASLRYVLTDHMRRCHGWKSADSKGGGGGPAAALRNANGSGDTH